MPNRSYRWSGKAGASSVVGVRAMIALALVMLTGCASPEAQPFVPADLPAEEASPGTSRQTAPAPRTETVRVASGVKVLVEWPAAPNADTTAMIEVFRDFYAGSLKAVVSGGKDTAYLDTLEGEAGKGSLSWVQEFLDERRSVRGTARLYAPNVSSVVGRGAQLDVCVDQSGLRLVDAATGRKAPRQSKWMREPFFQAAGMRRGDDGIWRIKVFRHAVLPSERAKGCLR